ncbi:hypothetical protein Chor_015446 [Crotalus horridus]
MVTLYHFDLPQRLEDQGGWRSNTTVEAFNAYAQFCFQTFGDRVKLWITINEPHVVAVYGYEKGIIAPGVSMPGVGGYLAAHHLIKAHAEAWHTYHQLFREQQGGLVSIALDSDWAEPFDPTSLADREAAKRHIAFSLDWFATPIFLHGDYPAAMKSRISATRMEPGSPSSRLPEFTEREKARIKGTADFFALNYYTARKIKHLDHKPGQPSLSADKEAEQIIDPSWPVATGNSWLAVVPWGLRRLLTYIKDTYNHPVIYITENGFSQSDPAPVDDGRRWEYFRLTLQEILKGTDCANVIQLSYVPICIEANAKWFFNSGRPRAVPVLLSYLSTQHRFEQRFNIQKIVSPQDLAIYADGVQVKGYFVWSLLDNFEWICGYSSRFGLFHVDFENSALPRVPYKSAIEYAKVIANNGLVKSPR